MRLTSLFALAAALGIGGCGGGNPLHETALGISAATSVGRGAELAFSAMTGTTIACVQVTTACTTYPCDSSATVTLGNGCGLPLGGNATGTMVMAGHFDSAESASFTATFTNVTVDNTKPIALASVSDVTASKSGGALTVTYAGENAVARSSVGGASIGAASSWTIAVDDKGNSDPADDSFSIQASSASGAAGVGASAKAATLTNVVVDPSCAKNPIGGSGSITEVSTFIPTIEKISFHSACDGKGEVNGHAYEFDVTP